MKFTLLYLFLSLTFAVNSVWAQADTIIEITDWEYHWGDFPELPVPGHYQIGKDQSHWTPFVSERLRPPGRGQQTIGWLRARLPDSLNQTNPALYFPGFDLAASIFIEDQLVFAFGGIEFQGYRHALIRLPRSSAGSYIYIRLFSDHSNLGLFKGVRLANYEDLIFFIIHSNAEVFGIGLFFLAVALVMGLIACLNWQRKEILALALTFACSGLVLLFVPTNTLTQFFFPHYLFNHLAMQFAMYIVPAPFTLFVEKMFPAHRSRALVLVRWSSIIYAVGALFLSTSGFIRPMSTFLPGEILVLIACLVVFGRVAQAIWNREPHSLIFGGASLLIFIGTSRDIFVEIGLLSAGVLPVSLHYWVLAFFIGMILTLVRSIMMTYRLVDQYWGQVKELNLQLEKKVEEQTLEIKMILQTIEQGILIVDQNGHITQDHSHYSLKLLREDQLATQTLDHAVLSKTDLSEDQRQQITHTLLAINREDLLVWELNAPSFPRFFHLHSGPEQKAIEAEWTPFFNNEGCISRVLVTLCDVTEVLQYRREAMIYEQEWQNLKELVRVPADKFRLFMDHASRLVNTCKESILQRQASEAYRVCLRHLHTLKGNARTLGLRRLSGNIHGYEDRLLKERSTLDSASLKGVLQQEIAELESQLSEYRRLNNEVLDRGNVRALGFYHEADTSEVLLLLDNSLQAAGQMHPLHEPLQAVKARFVQLFCLTLERMVHEFKPALSLIAQSLGKPMPELEVRGPSLIIPSALYLPLKDAFMHLFHNAMDHGLEDAETRIRLGKRPEGHILLNVRIDGKEVLLEWSDDGRGLHLKALREKARDASLNDTELASLIFEEHLSTKESVTLLSGRGIGLAAVRDLFQTHGGSIDLVLLQEHDESEYRPFKFIVKLPLHSSQTDLDKAPWLLQA